MDQTYVRNCPLTAPLLAISATATLVKTTNAFLPKIDGNIYPSVAAQATSLPVLTGINVPVTSTLAVALVLSKTAVFSYVQGTVVSNASLVDAVTNGNTVLMLGSAMPQIPSGVCLVGYFIIQTTSTATFTGGTTALNATNVATTYVDNGFFSGR